MSPTCRDCHPDLEVAARSCRRCLRRAFARLVPDLPGLWAHLDATVPMPASLVRSTPC